MEVKVLGSNSDGNCYVLNGEILLDAGLSIKDIKKGLNFNVAGIKGAIISHSHKDHAKAVPDLVKMGIDCYMGNKTFEEIDIFNGHVIIDNLRQFEIAHYSILPFECSHDVQCFGYLIYDKNTKEKLLFATDTYMLPYEFKGVNYYLIEANYSEKIIQESMDSGNINEQLVKRIYRSHFSVENCVEFLKSQDLSTAKKVILIHLSDHNSHKQKFIDTVYRETNIDTDVAEAGMILNLGLDPF